MTVSVRQAFWPQDKALLRSVRDKVFVEEQQVPIEIEWDDLDEEAIHFLALHNDTTPIGTARLLQSGKFGRMAVLSEWRDKGIGSQLLNALLRYANQKNLVLFCHAQVTAIAFYARAGFEARGERFMEAGIEHQTMYLPTSSNISPTMDK